MLKDVEADQDRCGELKQAEALAAGTFKSPAVPAPACLGSTTHRLAFSVHSHLHSHTQLSKGAIFEGHF